MQDLIKRAAIDLSESRHAVALTGAGISVESGIPPFRGKGGVWEKIDPMEFAHIDAFRRNPAKVWNVLIKEMNSVVDQARPNTGHLALAELEQMGVLKTIITQNVDGLHQAAGNKDVIEFHGSFAWQQCIQCGERCETSKVDMAAVPPLCSCGGIYRPEVIFFGEMIPPRHLSRSQAIAAQCDTMLVIGTSATVQPAAFMPVIAKESGARVIEINPEPTPLTGRISDYFVAGKAGATLQEILSEMRSAQP